MRVKSAQDRLSALQSHTPVVTSAVPLHFLGIFATTYRVSQRFVGKVTPLLFVSMSSWPVDSITLSFGCSGFLWSASRRYEMWIWAKWWLTPVAKMNVTFAAEPWRCFGWGLLLREDGGSALPTQADMWRQLMWTVTAVEFPCANQQFWSRATSTETWGCATREAWCNPQWPRISAGGRSLPGTSQEGRFRWSTKKIS